MNVCMECASNRLGLMIICVDVHQDIQVILTSLYLPLAETYQNQSVYRNFCMGVSEEYT